MTVKPKPIKPIKTLLDLLIKNSEVIQPLCFPKLSHPKTI